MFKIELLTTDKAFEDMVMKAMLKHINRNIKGIIRDMKTTVQEAIAIGLKKSPIYKELIGGKLGYELGFRKGSAQRHVDGIIEQLSKQFIIDFKDFKFNGISIDGGFDIYAIESDFSEVLNNKYAEIKIKGGSLPWLKWLLVEGDKIIVSTHKVVFIDTKRSRSGHAIMVEGGIRPFWRIPPEWSGVIDNNWITKACDDISDEINNALNISMSRIL
jgi:hypothetical protein